jgi:hypothetical protein
MRGEWIKENKNQSIVGGEQNQQKQQVLEFTLR